MGNAILRRSRRACALCNALGEHDHQLVDSYEGSCIKEAYDDFSCSRCGDLMTQWYGTNPENHEGPEKVEHEDSTCVTHGYDKTTCTACDEVISDEALDLDPNNHEGPEVDGEVTPSTCVTQGNREVICDACDVKIRDEELPLDPNNHEGPIGESGDGSSSTCVTHGDKEQHCEACGDWWSVPLPLDPNNHENWIDGGYQVEGHCEACGAVCEHEYAVNEDNYMYCTKCGYWDF